MPVRGAVLRGPTRVSLIYDLALDAFSERGLAERYGVSQPSIHEFKVKYGAEIAHAREDIQNELAVLWIANKVNRLAELEDDVDQINKALENASVDNMPRLMMAKHRAIRNAAEELGQLAPRAVDATIRVQYEITGVNMNALE